MASFIPSTRDERLEMLKSIGLKSFDELYKDVPKQVYLEKLNVPDGKTEMEVGAYMSGLAARNTVFPVVLRGAGAYDHFIPAIVDRVTSKEEFVTTYTPYQAEISQGVLQSIFEFQTMICEMTGMDVANASVYDGATAVAEGAMACLKRGREKVYAAPGLNPDYLATLKTYCWARNAELIILPEKDGLVDLAQAVPMLDKQAACLCVQQPNFYGLLEDAEAIAVAAHAVGAKMLMCVNPISLGLLKTPREYGADLAVGEGQPLGMPLSFGGPYLGFMAVTKDMMRNLPGRIVGQTADDQGRRVFVLTLQAREQHIRREKASSNICSNQALCAMRAAVYMAAMGEDGIRGAAENCYQKAHYFAKALCKLPGYKMVFQGEFFNEFVTTLPVPASFIEKALARHGVLSGLPIEKGMLWCVTEKHTKETLDEVIAVLKGVNAQ